MSDQNNNGHRARLKQRFAGTLGAGVADYELLELALTFAIPRKDVKPLAKDLMTKFGSLGGVLVAAPDQLAAVRGMGPASVIFVQVIQQLALRTRREKLEGRPVLANRIELLDYLYTKLGGKTREECHVVYLDSKLKLIADEVLFMGTLDTVAAAPRDVLKRALELNAAGLVVAHNHPSGEPTPSKEDLAFTASLAMAADALNVTVHDHVIVGEDAHYSFKGAGILS